MRGDMHMCACVCARVFLCAHIYIYICKCVCVCVCVCVYVCVLCYIWKFHASSLSAPDHPLCSCSHTTQPGACALRKHGATHTSVRRLSPLPPMLCQHFLTTATSDLIRAGAVGHEEKIEERSIAGEWHSGGF